MARENRPVLSPRVIMTGDLNDVDGSLMYQVLAGSQLTDTWAALRPRDPGFSCCQAADLSNPQSILDQRIDYIWVSICREPLPRHPECLPLNRECAGKAA